MKIISRKTLCSRILCIICCNKRAILLTWSCNQSLVWKKWHQRDSRQHSWRIQRINRKLYELLHSPKYELNRSRIPDTQRNTFLRGNSKSRIDIIFCSYCFISTMMCVWFIDLYAVNSEQFSNVFKIFLEEWKNSAKLMTWKNDGK